MGEIAEMMLDGTLCSSCGVFIGEDAGYPIECSSCAPRYEAIAKQVKKEANIARNARQKKSRCHLCNKKVKEVGMEDHINDVHGKLITITK